MAAAVSLLVIVALQLAVHPDMTWALRVMGTFAFLLGLLLGRRDESIQAVFLGLAPLAPVTLLAIADREGPAVDAVWMAGVAGALLSAGSWSRWELPAGWRSLATAWAFVVSLTWPVIVAREAMFRMDGFVDVGAITAATSSGPLTAPQAIGWVLHVTLTQLVAVLLLERMTRLFQAGKGLRVVAALCAGVTVASLVAVYQATVDFTFLSNAFWAEKRRTPGTLLDANAFGLCAALAGPTAWLVLRRSRLRHRTGVALAVLLVNVAGMWFSGSRTTLLCGVANLGGLAIAWTAASGIPKRRLIPLVSAIVVALVLLAVAGSTVGPLRRLTEGPAGRDASLSELWERGGYGTAANDMLREHPLAGVGIGSYHLLASDYSKARTGEPLPFDNAQNWWRHEIAEFGLLGALPMLVATAAAVVLLAERARPDAAFTAFVLRGAIVGIGLGSLLGMPTQNPIVLLWLMLLLAWLLASIARNEAPLLNRHPTAMTTAALLIAVIVTAIDLASAQRSLSVIARTQRDGRELAANTYPPEIRSDGREYRWTRGDARFIWPLTSRWLVVGIRTDNPTATVADPVQITLETQCGPVASLPLPAGPEVQIGLSMPEGLSTLDLRLGVSRTWRPSRFGSPDARQLGVEVRLDRRNSGDRIAEQDRFVDFQACSGGF